MKSERIQGQKESAHYWNTKRVPERRGQRALQFAATDLAALPSTMSEESQKERERFLLLKLPIDHPPNPYGGFFEQTIQVTEVRDDAHSSGEILALPEAGTFPGETKPTSRGLKQTPTQEERQRQRDTQRDTQEN